MLSSRGSTRYTARINAENRMVKQREKEHDHQIKWNDRVDYYKRWEMRNNRFDEWTSSQYYETNNKKIDDIKKRFAYKENLERRREKLRKLFEEENRSHQIELMVRNRHAYSNRKSEPPLAVLKEINDGLKLEEQDRRKHQSETALYNHWRNNNPVLQQHYRNRNLKDLKLSWLDQQIEKRIEKERAEEECRKIIEEKNKWLVEEKEKEQQLQREIADKNEKLHSDLVKQMEELEVKEKESTRLQKEQEYEVAKMAQIELLEQERLQIDKKRKQRELALENLKFHKLKLKQNAANVRDALEGEKEFIEKLLESEMVERIENEQKKSEVKIAMKEFLKYACEQQDLEKKRQSHFDFMFESEGKSIYEKQKEVWEKEQRGRDELLKEVVRVVKQQINENVQKTKDRQRCVLEERQNAIRLLEDYDTRIRQDELEEERRKRQWKKEVELQLKEKKVREAEQKSRFNKSADDELEKVRKEEERLRKEIIELQRQ
ncbi:hypothetical protein FQA39_LY14847 [Lamprigera yunnana]|nr:hypothetical protein FQA39_LY14847 [Lamprigera yunnana]